MTIDIILYYYKYWIAIVDGKKIKIGKTKQKSLSRTDINVIKRWTKHIRWKKRVKRKWVKISKTNERHLRQDPITVRIGKKIAQVEEDKEITKITTTTTIAITWGTNKNNKNK